MNVSIEESLIFFKSLLWLQLYIVLVLWGLTTTICGQNEAKCKDSEENIKYESGS